MADNEYKIVIQLQNEDSSGNVMSGGEIAGKQATQTDGEKQAAGAGKALQGLVSYGAVRAFADNLISYEISQVELRTGAREYEQRLRFGYEMANKVLNVGTATVMGAITGGPVGAIVGFVGSTMYTAIGYMQKANTLRTQQNLEDISIGMANMRAGVSGRRSSRQ